MATAVRLTPMIRGFEEASRRFNDVMRGRDADATFLALFEALNWAVSIDDRFRSIWETEQRSMTWWTEGFTHGDVVKGVRFGRNRVHHQWADALWLSTAGFAFPLQFPLGFVEWRWRPELPPGRDDTFKAEYDYRMAAAPARRTLGELADCFGDARRALGGDPPG